MPGTTDPTSSARFSPGTGLLLTLLVAGQVMISMDFCLASVALPSIARELAVGPGIAQWVISAMSLGFGGFLIVGGRLADIYGQKNCLIAGLALYSFGALGSGFSGAIVPLIAFRGIQGIGGAMMFPATLSLIFLTFADGPPRFKALTISMTAQFLASPVGVVIAGGLIAALGWRGAFFSNAPIGLVCLAAAPFLVPKSTVIHHGSQSVDFPGAVLATLGCALLVWTIPSLIAEGTAAASATLIGFGTSIVVLGGFVILQRSIRAPLISRGVLGCQNMVAGLIVGALIVTGLSGIIGLGLIGMQQGLDYSPLRAGLWLMPYGIMSIVMSTVAPKIAPYVLKRPSVSLIAATGIVAGSHLLISLAPADATAIWFLAAGLLIAPVGGILGINLAMSEALQKVPAEHQGVASALLYAAMQVALAIGVSLMVSASAPVESGAEPSLIAFASSFRVGAAVSALGIVFCLLITRQTKTLPDALPKAAL